MAKQRKEVFTRIDYSLYQKIKEKNYKIADLIRIGYEFSEGIIEPPSPPREKIEELMNKIDDLNKKLDKISFAFENLRRELENLKQIVTSTKKRISERLFPSKADMLSSLKEIEDKINYILTKM